MSLLVAVWWWRVESRTAEPLVDTRVFLRPGVVVANVAAILSGFGAITIWVALSDFVQTPASAGYGFSSSVLGATSYILVWAGTSALARPLAGVLLRRVGLGALMILGGILVAAGGLFAALLHAHPWELYVAASTFGAGLGLISVAMPILILEGAPQSQMGVASGLNAILRTLGGAFAGVVGGVLLSAEAGSYASLSGYTASFFASAACGVFLALFVFVWRRRHRRRRVAQSAMATASTS
jgi:MFS family permease